MESLLYSIDLSLFRRINEGWSNPFLDRFFSFVTDYHHFLIVIIPWFLYLLIWGKAKDRWLVLSVIIAVALSDQISAHGLKHWVARVRPCNALEGVLTPSGKSQAFSFPSSHAANMGSSMFLLWMAFRPWGWFFAGIALLVGLSRVYLGLHYPSDVLGGYALGLLVGVGVLRVVQTGKDRLNLKMENHPPSRSRRTGSGKARV